MTTTNETKIHKFEAAGLGQAPFTFIGHEEKKFQAAPGAPVQAGGSCDYCAHAIINFYWLRSADGKQFKVGSECIRKAGDAGLKKQIAPILRAATVARENARIAAAKATLERPEVQAALKAQKHPFVWRAEKGDTLLDYVNWMFANSGNAGSIRAARVVESAL